MPFYYGQWFAVFHLEDGVELRDLQQVADFLGQVQQFEFAALFFGSGEGTDKLFETGAVDIVHVAQVQQDPSVPLGEQVVHRLTYSYAALTKGDSALKVGDQDAIRLTGAELYAHLERPSFNREITLEEAPW